MTIDKCAVCNINLKLKPIHKRKYKGPFCCSKQCRGEFLKKSYKGSVNPNYKFTDELTKFMSIRFVDVKRRAKKQNIPFDLDLDFLVELFHKQKGLCAYSGLPMKIVSTNFKDKGQADLDVMSLDKVNPELGYVKSNVVFCCSAINKLKGNGGALEVAEFIKGLSVKSITVKIKKLVPHAVVPSYAKFGDAGCDLTATSHEFEISESGRKLQVYGTGLSFELPIGYVGLLFPRSSIAKTSLSLTNCVGVLDCQYRGEVKFKFAIDGGSRPTQESSYKVGDRIGQIIIMPFPQVNFEEVEELTKSERGTGGFGSSGK